MAGLNRVPENMVGVSPNTLEKELVYLSTFPDKFVINFNSITVGNFNIPRFKVQLGTVTLG